MDLREKEIEQLKAEIEYYKKLVTWYRDTYEHRSFLGIVKEKLNAGIKRNFRRQGLKKITAINPDIVKTPSRIRNVLSIDKSSFYSTHPMDDKLLRIGIFVHLYYQDIWGEIDKHLRSIGINFDLLVTVCENDPECDRTIKRIKSDYPHAIILKVPNKGLDVGPFFELVNYVIGKGITFDYILKIHTKKSLGVNAVIGENWRKKSYESLMGSFDVVSHILRLFRVYPSIGMIGPYETRMSVSENDTATGKNANAENIKKMSKRLGIKDRALDFFGGTMFWARWKIFEDKFKETTLTINDFEPGYKKDELLSHAMERLLASIVRDAGYRLHEMSRNDDYLFYKNRRRKICWIHPGYGIGGGNRVIFEICQEQMKYYDVYSVNFMGHPFNGWMQVNHSVLNFNNAEEAKKFLESEQIDYVMATGWQTVDFVKSLTTPLKKFYFIQDYEPWFADASINEAKSTYDNSFNGSIVIAGWLMAKLWEEHKLPATFVKLGTRLYPEKKSLPTVLKPHKILIYFKLKSHKGRGADLILALLQKLVSHPEIELNVFGHEEPGIQGVKFHGEVHKEALLSLYRSNDIFIDLSRHRGIATIALEIAQFGVVPLLAAREYGLKEYGFEDDKNCLFVDDVADAYAKAIQLCQDPAKYNELRKGVTLLGQTFRWEQTVNDFNQITEIIS